MLHRHDSITKRHHTRDRFALVVIFIGMLVAAQACLAQGNETNSQQLAVPATFVRYVKTPGAADFIKRPTAMHWDRFHNELLAADSGHNRVVVFTASGSFKFEFSLGMDVTAPADLITDPEGYIYVLGSNQGGRVLHRFDFDGLSLGPVPVPAALDNLPVSPRSGACDDAGRLYLLDNDAKRVLILDPETGLIDHFSVGTPEQSSAEVFGLGFMAVSGDEVLIPVATGGTVLRHALDGTYLGTLGHFGSKPGALNFPVAVEVSPEGITGVLDQGRFCVVCYDTQGQVIGEFGGKGFSPGWFLNPSLLAIPSADRVVIGQIYNNAIQVCVLPEFVRGRNQLSANKTASPKGMAESAVNVDPSHASYPFAPVSRGSQDPQNPVHVSHLEVSN